MQKPSLGWQSWSPPTFNWPHLPQWDYDPLKSIGESTLSELTKKLKPHISLWCSWHSNGTKINEKLILEQAVKFRSHKYVPEYILIDDGWCSWGDWTSPDLSKFEHGILSLSTELEKINYKTGLWIEPFLVDPKSDLANSHPDWLIKNDNGTFFNGFSSYPFIKNLSPKYLLDFTRSDVIEYLFNCIDIIVKDWGITLLKLDHLYAPYFAPNLKKANLASNVLINLLTYIQKTYPQVYTIACGCPFIIAQNRVDSIRISKDINSPQLNTIPIINYLLYIKRKKLLNRELIIANGLAPLPFGIDPDAAINYKDAEQYYKQWMSGVIQVFGLGYNL